MISVGTLNLVIFSILLGYSPHPTPYTPHPTPCTRHPTPYTLLPTPYTLQFTPYTLHSSPHTPRPTPSTLHPNPTPYTRNLRKIAYKAFNRNAVISVGTLNLVIFSILLG